MSCKVCNTTPATPCGGCGAVSYCGKECQKTHWKEHKAKCKAYKIVTSAEEHGRNIIAARDIKAGETLMVTRPFCVGPRMHKPALCCLGCHRAADKLLSCDKCGLPVCSVKCAGSNTHQMECTLITNSKDKNNVTDLKLGIMVVTPLRIIGLKFTKPELYATAMSMEPNLEVLKQRELWKYLDTQVIQPVLGLQIEGITLDIVERCVGIILTNCFEVMAKGCLLFGMFFEPALMNHHCVGNTRLMLDSSNLMTVIASQPIKKSKPVKFNYGRALDTTWTRQVNLLENKYFTCQCERCLDPTELGSNLSSLKCREDKCEGSTIPKDPMSMKGDWICVKCEDVVNGECVRKLLKSLQKDTENLDRNDMKAVKDIFKKYARKLHKNHGVLTELKQYLISGMGRLPGYEMDDLKESDHRQKVLLCQEALDVLDIVEPGMSLGRGLMMFELHSSLVMVSNMEFEKKQNPGQLLCRLLEADKFLREAEKILKMEPRNSPYGHLAATVQSNMLELSTYIESVKNM
eukprot:TRINITY_DN15811_c0_g1_i1.p1 TRINITY_DN15811_c0_g1~~TRINITY_DN15811_c0_g1_i1.p1  ORF type:complete len:518 (+),score=133.58 TRINITY_DN15811_c0_g1_i1:73-1626(+)